MKNCVFSGNARRVYVAGDLHGDYESFRRILDLYKGMDKDSLLLFLGDYADRGCYGLEIITMLKGLLNTREDIVALKGNHEMYINGEPAFSPCDLIYEAETKYGSWEKFYHEVLPGFLKKLYIAAVINKVLFVHAGISSRIKTLKDMEKEENEIDLVWSDPSHLSGEHPNTRGAGVIFGEDVTAGVLSSLGLRMMVRSHEPRKAAYRPYIEHGGKIITANSCSSYGEPWKPFLLKLDTMSLEHETIYL